MHLNKAGEVSEMTIVERPALSATSATRASDAIATGAPVQDVEAKEMQERLCQSLLRTLAAIEQVREDYDLARTQEALPHVSEDNIAMMWKCYRKLGEMLRADNNDENTMMVVDDNESSATASTTTSVDDSAGAESVQMNLDEPVDTGTPTFTAIVLSDTRQEVKRGSIPQICR